MRKEYINHSGPGKDLVFRPDRKAHRAPKINHEYTREGTRYYKDDIGGVHVADIYDTVFGKRDAKAMAPKAKHQFQRTFKPRR